MGPPPSPCRLCRGGGQAQAAARSPLPSGISGCLLLAGPVAVLPPPWCGQGEPWQGNGGGGGTAEPLCTPIGTGLHPSRDGGGSAHVPWLCAARQGPVPPCLTHTHGGGHPNSAPPFPAHTPAVHLWPPPRCLHPSNSCIPISPRTPLPCAAQTPLPCAPQSPCTHSPPTVAPHGPPQSPGSPPQPHDTMARCGAPPEMWGGGRRDLGGGTPTAVGY